MRKCLDCKNYVRGKISINGPDTPSQCGIGNDEYFNRWWEENKSKSYKEASESECYEPTETDAILDSMCGKASEILKMLKENRNGV